MISPLTPQLAHVLIAERQRKELENSGPRRREPVRIGTGSSRDPAARAPWRTRRRRLGLATDQVDSR